MGLCEQGIGLTEHDIGLRALHKLLIIRRLDARRSSYHNLVIVFVRFYSLEHSRQIVFNFLFTRSCQQGYNLFFVCHRRRLQERSHLVGRGITYIMDGVMMLLLEEIHLERQDREELIDIAFDILNTILFPSPDFG